MTDDIYIFEESPDGIYLYKFNSLKDYINKETRLESFKRDNEGYYILANKEARFKIIKGREMDLKPQKTVITISMEEKLS